MERHILYERMIVDFVNAEDTDAACSGLIENINKMQDFSTHFVDKARKRFPFLERYTSLPEKERMLFDFFCKEQSLLNKVGGVLAYIMAELTTYDPHKKTLTYSLAPPVAPMNSKDLDFSEPQEELISDLEERLMTEFRLLGDIYPEYKDWKFQEADDLVQVGINILESKRILSDLRYEEIKGLSEDYPRILSGHRKIQEHQKNLKKVLIHIQEGKNLHRSETLQGFLLDYNKLCKVEVSVSLDGSVYNKMIFPDEESFLRLDVNGCTNDAPWFEPYRIITVFFLVEFLRSFREKS